MRKPNTKHYAREQYSRWISKRLGMVRREEPAWVSRRYDPWRMECEDPYLVWKRKAGKLSKFNFNCACQICRREAWWERNRRDRDQRAELRQEFKDYHDEED